MEYYHYINIFGTNGLEDVLVICFLITFALFARNFNKANNKPKIQRGPTLTSKIGDTIVVVDDETESCDPRLK